MPIQGTIRKKSLDFMTINLPGSKLHRDLRIPFTVLQTKFHSTAKPRKQFWKSFCQLDHLKREYTPVVDLMEQARMGCVLFGVRHRVLVFDTELVVAINR
jgi:hypothetical protein